MTQLCYYRNRTARGQVINLNSGRSVHVPERGEVLLAASEETSVEIKAKLRSAQGLLRFEAANELVTEKDDYEKTPTPFQQVEPAMTSSPMEQKTKEETAPDRSRRKR